jgi:hypothetical protein
MKRDDRKATPLIVAAGYLKQYGFPIEYTLRCMQQNYDGRPIDGDSFGCRIDRVEGRKMAAVEGYAAYMYQKR